MTATNAETKKERETTRGYSGDPQEGEAPPYVQNLPEDSVISPIGVTRPPEPGIADPYFKERTDDEQFAGKVLMKGKTHHGFYYERIVDVIQPRTKSGILQILIAHFPDLDRESFDCQAVSDEEAEKKEKEWADKLRNKEKTERDKKAKGYSGEGGSSTHKEQKEQEDYDARTVVELKELAAQRNLETKYDWTKDDYVKALKKGDKHSG
jgi:hypothetical protein